MENNSPEVGTDVAAACVAEAEAASSNQDDVSGIVMLAVDDLMQGFTQSLEEEALNMDGYLRAYTEMSKVFEVLGTIFNFICNDVQSKLNIMRCYRKGGSCDYYSSIQSMLEYEKNQPSLTQPSASRTLLRLHRALAFVSGLMRAMHALDMDAKLGSTAQPIYAKTLAHHHGWIISKTVAAVILLLPTKQTVFNRLVGEDVSKQRYLDSMLLEASDVMDKVFAATEALYAEYDMLNLP